MLKVECESCKAPYQVDERRVPLAGLKMRCPKCGHTFLVTDPSKGAAPAAAGPAPKPPAPKKATMVGLAAPKSALTGGKPPQAPPPASTSEPPGFDLDLALPAVKPAVKPVAKPVAKPPVPSASFAAKPTAPALAAVAAPPAPTPPAPPAFPGLDDLDLPALAGDVGLPAVVKAPPAKRAPVAAAAPAPTPAGPQPFSFEIDLPAALSPPAAPAPSTFGALDLPVPKGDPSIDLPSPKGVAGFGDLPMPKAGDAARSDMPAVHGGRSGGGSPFGELDLPIVQNELPQVADGGAHLPSAMGPGAHLPSAMGPGAHLPSAMGPGAHLPSAMGPGAHLPSAMGPGAHLPSAMSPGAHLPSAMGPGAHLPSAMEAGAHLPSPLSLGAQLPSHADAAGAGGPPPIAFGELDLPLVGTGAGDPFSAPAATSGFGEVDLPTDNAPPGLGAPPSAAPSAGGMAFGEVDLGASADTGSPMGPPPAMSAGSFAFQEASLDAAALPRPAAHGRLAPVAPHRASKMPKVLGVALALIVVGGAGLQLTPLGAFGYLFINDKLHAKENAADAAVKGDLAQKKLAADTFSAAQAAADELVEARKRAPRSRPLGAYAAFIEYANQVRFGTDPARAARVSTFITDVPRDEVVPYLAAAKAAQIAQGADWKNAKSAIDAAVAKEPKDGIQHELSILRGEVALAEKDPAAALAAFDAAHSTGASARTYFGIARAQHLANAPAKAKEAIDGVLKLTPDHAGALTLRAELAWEVQRDADVAMKDLSTVLDEKSKGKLGPTELSHALATRGRILLASDRASDARAAFDEAVKADPRNVSALVGQGDVLYADGRFTEALTRFDEAVSKDPSSIGAMIGSAKSKIALERLQDAKNQLTAARQKAPKDMTAVLWLARTEEALGNKKVAEELYASAIALASPDDRDAIEPYAASARFLASQGRNAEAAAQLEQARAKLPDSAALQRAIGEVAVAQGQFEEALGHFEAALQKNPNDLGTRFRLGVTYRRMHKLDLAAKALDEVAAIDPEYPGIALERGLLFEESGDIQKALEQFQSASQKAPTDVDLMLRIGAAYVAIGDIDKALPLLLQVKEQRPNSAEVNHFLGRAYLKQGGLESAAAMRYLQRAVALDPNKAEYHLYVAWAANEATPAQLGLARTHVDKALQLDKLLGDAYWQRGVVERKEGQIVDAIKDLKRALELRPSRHEAHAALAEAYEDKNDMAAATSEWQKAIAGDARPPLWRWKYGKILAERSQYAEAAKHLVYAVENGKTAQPRPGWLGTAAFEAGEALRRTGQKNEACEHYRLYMELAAPTAPDRRDAIKAQDDLGCPWEGGR